MIDSGLVRYHDALVPLMVGIDTVFPHPENYNNGDVEEIVESIEVSGMYRPIYVQASTRYIVAGNHTWLACKTLDADSIPVVELDIDDEEAFRIMIEDNEIARKARRDNFALARILENLAQTPQGLRGTGMTAFDLEVIKNLAEIPVEHNEFGTWPTLTFQVPPTVRAAFMKMTREADSDKDKFELLLRLAGWDGK